jgi:hypothetical protein
LRVRRARLRRCGSKVSLPEADWQSGPRYLASGIKTFPRRRGGSHAAAQLRVPLRIRRTLHPGVPRLLRADAFAALDKPRQIRLAADLDELCEQFRSPAKSQTLAIAAEYLEVVIER